ncbi:MAG: tubulin-like doman-containing protein, partial [Abditibacteriales bacterium]|nr:tubulin-like doman-containing protein [Abditibacteriales bacterium]
MPTATEHAVEFNLFAEQFNREADRILLGRRLEEEQALRTLKPTVIVGLGGTGCEIGARLKRALHWYYRQLETAVEMAQFVLLDSEPLAGQHNPLIRQTFVEDSEYHFLGGFDPAGYIAAHYPRESDLQRWWDRNYEVAAEPITAGCKQIRQLGRLCLYRQREQVAVWLRNALDRARELDARAVADLNLPPLPSTVPVTFYVLTGSCGGTGSGMFLDVCYLIHRVAREAGLVNPSVRAVIVLPTLYVERARRTREDWARHYQANGYAFFKEVHHFILNGPDWRDHCMDADERKRRGDPPLPDGWRPAARFYLMDNVVAGQVLRDLSDIYLIAADALFHIIATPVGVPEEGRAVVGFDSALRGRKDGKATAFSSLGVSYIIYPAKTIARCAAAAYLRDLIYNHYIRPLTDADRQQAVERARELFTHYAAILDAAHLAQAVSQQAHQLTTNFPKVADIERHADRRERGKRLGFYGAMEAADKTAESLVTQGKQSIETVYQQHVSWLKQVEALVHRELNTCAGGDCLAFVQQVFRELKHRVSQAEPSGAVPTDESRSARPIVYAHDGEAYKKEVQRLEADWIPNRFQQRALKNHLRNFVDALKNRYLTEVTERAAEVAREYRGAVVAKLEDAIARCDRAAHDLRLVGDALNDQADEYDPTQDERYLVVTTQLVPSGGVEGAVQSLSKTLCATLADDARQLLNQLAEKDALWALSAPDADDRQTARRTVVETLVAWAIRQQGLHDRLGQAVHEVGTSDIGWEDFKNRVLMNMLRLSDATWELDVDRAAMQKGDVAVLHSLAKPDNMNNALLPSNLQEQAQAGAVKPLDQRRIMVLQSQHAAPLHAVIGMDVLRGAYRQWVQSKDRFGDPVHLSRGWNRGVGLVEIFPEVTGLSSYTIRYFALGNFTDWLTKDKRHAAMSTLVAGWNK